MSHLLAHLALSTSHGASGGLYVRLGLVGERKILVERRGVLHFHPDHRSSDEEGTSEQTPVYGEFGHVCDFLGVDGWSDGATSGLNALVEAGEVGEFAAVVGE